MKIAYSVKSALIGLKTNKSRSALTILGIVIGITSIILITSISSGARNLILGEIQDLGSNTLSVVPGKEVHGPSDFSNFFLDSLKKRDLEALQKKNNVPTLESIMPIIIVPGSVSYKGETYSGQTFGASEIFVQTMGFEIKNGNFFTETDVRQRSNVAVIGEKAREKLFGESDALNEKIKIKDRNFRVIGIFPPTGGSVFFNVDDAIVVPYTTAQTYLTGADHFNEFIARATSEATVEQTALAIKATLRETHGINDSKDDDFTVNTQKDLAKRIGTVTAALAATLASVAAISLVVGGVGIMNIMLVSVTERTREIGLRKAIGGTYNDILRQFLFEAMVLTGIGGIVGIILGGSFAWFATILIKKFAGLNWGFTLPVSSVLLGLGVSVFVGLVFGIYPARKAARKSPIEALRYE